MVEGKERRPNRPVADSRRSCRKGRNQGRRQAAERPFQHREEDHPVTSFAAFQKQLYRVGVLQKAFTALDRNGSRAEASVILVPADRSLYLGLRLIALIYLGIGLYVLLRRWTAPKSTHFYVFCLVSFVLYSFHYTGKLNTFDWIIFWANTAAWMLQPALFLHFALVFPEKRKFVARYPLLAGAGLSARSSPALASDFRDAAV